MIENMIQKKYVKTQKSHAELAYEKEAKVNEGVWNSEHFKTACQKAGIEPTKRQASKFKMKKGKAYKEGRRGREHE